MSSTITFNLIPILGTLASVLTVEVAIYFFLKSKGLLR